jgi:hypothetical protein
MNGRMASQLHPSRMHGANGAVNTLGGGVVEWGIAVNYFIET